MNLKRIETGITNSIKWLKHSGIIDVRSENSGGVFAWYDPESQSYPFYYSEITGYMISTLIHIEREIEKDPLNIQLADQSFRWLKSKMLDPNDGSFRCRYSGSTNQCDDRLCTFDNGIILNGLVSLHSETQSEDVFDIVQRVSSSLRNRIESSEIFAKQRSLPPTYGFEEEGQGWSRQEGTFLIKAFAKMPQFENRQASEDHHKLELLMDKVLKMQMGNGQIITDRFEQSTYLHPFCYTLEGMLMAWSDLPKEVYRDAIVKSANWMLSLQKVETGGFPHCIEKGEINSPESSDINAQVLRLWSVLISKGWIEKNNEKFSCLVDRVLSFQVQNDSDPRAFGGFRYGYAKKGGEKSHINAWATMFAMQALHYARMSHEGTATIDPRGLI